MTCRSLPPKVLLASVVLAAMAVACLPATQTPVPLAPTWDVTVSGEIDTTYSVVNTLAYSVYSVGTAVKVALPSSDGAYEVVLFLPDDVEPGMYSISDAFAQQPTTTAARFGALRPPSRHYYESTGGTIVISSAGQYLSGAFEFGARNSFTGGSITVHGAFLAIPWGY